MATAKITLEGDSKSAQKALNDAKSAAEGLDNALDSVSTEAAMLASRTTPAIGSLDRVAKATQRTGEQMGKAAGAVGSLSSAVGAVNPQLGAAVSVVGSLSGALGSLSSLVNPLTIGLTAVTVAVGLGVKAWRASREAQRAHVDAMRDSRAEMERLQAQAQGMATAMDDAAGRVSAVASAYREVSEELGRIQQQRTQYDAANLIGEEEARVRRLEAALEDEGRRREELRDQIREQERALSAAAQQQLVYNTRANRREHEAAAAELARLNAELDVQAQRIAQASAAYGEAGQALDDLRLAMSRVGQTAGEAARATVTSASSATRSVSELADAMLRAASASGDWSRVMRSLDSGGSMGQELARMLEGIDERLIQQLALPAERIQELYRESMSGAEALRAQESALVGQLDARAAAMDAILAAESESLRVAYAREQLAVDSATRQAQARMEQAQWLEEINRTSEEQAALDAQILASAEAKVRAGQLLSTEERKAYEQRVAMAREEAEATVARIEAAKEAMKLDSKSLGYQGAIDMLGGIADAMGTAIASGENMGKAIAKSAKQMVSGMAKQFGQLFLSIGSGMLFLPGQQAAGVGLMAAGFALQALGGAIGGGGKRNAGSGGSQQRESGTGTTIVEYTRRETPGMRARQEGERYDNMMRYGIDRGRAFA